MTAAPRRGIGGRFLAGGFALTAPCPPCVAAIFSGTLFFSVHSPARVLTALDRTALATYCNAYGPRVEATNKYRVMVKSPRGFPMQSPCVALANRQAEIMMRVAGEFGFTTASRSRIRVEPEEEPDLFGSS